jgi:hypothetical protein
LVPRSSGTPVATWAWPTWVVSRRHVLQAVFILLEFPSPSRRIFIGSHSLPPSLVRRIGPSLATKNIEVTHLGCATVHQLVTCFLLMHSEVDPVRNIARGIHCISPEPSRSPMLIKHCPCHLTQGSVFPFHNTILGRRIRPRKLVFKTQVMEKGFEEIVSEFRAITTTDSSYGISMPLILQPQDKISNETKCLPFLLNK